HGRFRISGCVHLTRATYSYSIGEQAAVRRPKFQRRCLVDLPDAFDALWGVECLPCCLIACLVTDSIASTKPSTAIARLHKRAIPTQPKSFNPSPHAGAWQQQPAI